MRETEALLAKTLTQMSAAGHLKWIYQGIGAQLRSWKQQNAFSHVLQCTSVTYQREGREGVETIECKIITLVLLGQVLKDTESTETTSWLPSMITNNELP